jgi:hypothetical protein
MLTPEEIDLVAEETCQSRPLVRLIALQLDDTSHEFSPADLIEEVILAVGDYREAPG